MLPPVRLARFPFLEGPLPNVLNSTGGTPELLIFSSHFFSSFSSLSHEFGGSAQFQNLLSGGFRCFSHVQKAYS